MHGLWKLTWLEIKIFLREPLGAFGSILFPVLVFVVLGRLLGGRLTRGSIAATGKKPMQHGEINGPLNVKVVAASFEQ